jgi:predicted dithiol-disulfide oxidoreductase (DUF899 family)
MVEHAVVSEAEWVEARKRFLEKEKEFTRARDALNRERRALPWVKVETNYTFDGPDGTETLAQLFAGKRQLIVQHFMFDPGWNAACKSCSFWADGFNGFTPHLAQRDTAFVSISRAPLEKLEAFKKRMGWTFKWVSSLKNDFNRDYQVTITPEENASGEAYYNYRMSGTFGAERPGISVFYRDGGDVYHTYSCYARGLDMLNAAYHYLDLTPKGRDEDSLHPRMTWVRLHDEYGK